MEPLTIGETLRRLRKQALIRQDEMGIKAGVGKVTVSNVECDRCDPRLSTLSKMAEALGYAMIVTFEKDG